MHLDHVQEAMQDVLAIQKAIRSYRSNKDKQIPESTYQANKFIQTLSIFMALTMVLIEFSFDHIIANTMITKNSDFYYRVLGVICIGGFLALAVGILYFTVAKAAAKEQEDLGSYVRRNFTYLQNLSHVSDLFIKFCVVAALIFAQKPEWVAPFLFLFIGDYLLQGRFFTLKIKMTFLLAILCFIAGFGFFMFNQSQVLWPLLMFAFINWASLSHLRKLKRVQE